jgi:hypothetical protein
MKYLKAKMVLAATLVLIVAAPVGASAQELVGKGEWQSLSGEAIRGTWTAALVREGGEVTGTFKLTGSNVFTGGPVSGTLDASSIMLGIMVEGTKQATFGGKLDAGAIKGEWQSDGVKDHGVWWGSLTAVKAGQPERP